MIGVIVFSICVSWVLCHIVIFISNAFDSMSNRRAESVERNLAEELNKRRNFPAFTIKDLEIRGKMNRRFN